MKKLHDDVYEKVSFVKKHNVYLQSGAYEPPKVVKEHETYIHCFLGPITIQIPLAITFIQGNLNLLLEAIINGLRMTIQLTGVVMHNKANSQAIDACCFVVLLNAYMCNVNI